MGIVLLKRSERKKLNEKFGVSNATLTRALRYEADSLLCRRIRLEAINHFHGIYYELK